MKLDILPLFYILGYLSVNSYALREQLCPSDLLSALSYEKFWVQLSAMVVLRSAFNHNDSSAKFESPSVMLHDLRQLH